jgi:XTP/dITP diphosphohydrolase
MKIIFATKNENKLKEVKEILKDTKMDIVSMREVQINVDIVEDGDSFEENARKKAIEIMMSCGLTVLSDDSGLEIDFLNKQPGVHSSRFLGEDTSYEFKNNHILNLLKDIPKEKRSARFVSVIAAAFTDGTIITTKGTIEGFISTNIEGSGGFGYDPIFFVDEFNTTLGNISSEQKNLISHRGIALRKMKDFLLDKINEVT